MITRRISTKVQALDTQVCSLYDRTFRGRDPDKVFWQELEKLDEDLGKRFKGADTMLAVDGAVKAFWTTFRRACLECRAR